MTKWLDYFLIIALAVNIALSLYKYKPTTKVFNYDMPTWIALTIQAVCIGLIVYKILKVKR